jgi:very-short-patch-repair endonuclease
VQARIEVAAEVDADLRCWLDAGNRVKNLETVQGDECDVMILGFGYGKDGDGRLQANFGPLSQQGGYRRLNVAVTRARQQTIVVASIRAAEVPSTAGPGGAQVRAYLDYAERGATALGSAGPGLDRYESALEEDVANALRGRGWQVETQAGVGGYRIDLAVRDTGTPGRYLAGIECDGATYHSAQTARDRDIARQRVLERLGWNILRVWSPDWYHEKQRVADELDEALRKLGGPGPGGSEPVAEPVPGPAPFAGAGPAAGLPPEAEAWEPHRVVRGNPSGQHIVDVVAREGPLHLEELLEALRADFGIERLTARRRAGLLAAVDALRGAGVVIRGDWAWPAGMDPREVPVRVRRGGPPRPLARYSDEELLRAMEIACRAGGRIPEHQLPRAVADLLGIDLRAAADSRLGALVERAVAGGYITVDGDGMAVALDRRAIG